MTKRIVAMVTLVCFMMVFTVPSVRAAVPEGQDHGRSVATAVTHTVTPAQLHQAVRVSHEQAVAARDSVAGFLARPDVRTQLRRVGLAPERVASRVAALNDEEILRLQHQIMAADLQNSPAGLSTGAIIAIVAVSVGGALLLLWILVHEEDLYYYY